MKIDQITFTRFLAAMSIVVYHYGKNIFPFNSECISFFFQQANIGVSYFFILSGFVMMIAYGGKSHISVISFYKKRLIRIYPVYFFALFLVVVHTLVFDFSVNYFELILNILIVQAWIPGMALSLNFTGWSLSVEFFFYLIFPTLLNKYYGKTDFKTLTFFIFSLWFISQSIFVWANATNFYQGDPSPSHDLLYYFPLMHLNEFLVGNLAGIILIKLQNAYSKNYDWLIVVIIALILLLLKTGLGVNFHNGLLACLFVPFIVTVSISCGAITSVLRKKIFVFLGEISYAIYILQFPVYLWSMTVFDYWDIHSNTYKFYIFLISLISISAISHLMIEAPLKRKYENYAKLHAL